MEHTCTCTCSFHRHVDDVYHIRAFIFLLWYLSKQNPLVPTENGAWTTAASWFMSTAMIIGTDSFAVHSTCTYSNITCTMCACVNI